MNLSWKVLLVFAGIFVAGAVTGGALGIHWARKANRNPVEHFRQVHMSRIARHLDLTDQQQEQIKPAIAKADEEFHRLRKLTGEETKGIFERLNSEISKCLTPEQNARFQEMQRRQSERMKDFMKGGRGQIPPSEEGRPPEAQQPPPPAEAHP
ncbi:MAG: hypothetical protein WC378_20915 [Opitutaceae bacterium]